ncbi:MAG: mechanosensitive ion channel domain-containing protein [Verrucomicrobiota bacterium]
MLEFSQIKLLVLPFAIQVVVAIAIFVIGRWVAKWIVERVRKILEKADRAPILVNFIANILSALLYLVIVVAALGQLGVDTTSLVALVGAAGLAVGLALQDSLKNFAAGVMLVVFRPFKTGHFIEAAGVAGVVEKIEIFSSTLRTLDNREIIVPNGEIYSGPITNASARDTRRVDMMFGIGYDDDLRKAKGILQSLIDDDERVLKDPAPFLAVGELADSSVNFLVRPWVKAEDYFSFKCDFTEAVKLHFDKEGISIPYPQMDVHLPAGNG